MLCLLLLLAADTGHVPVTTVSAPATAPTISATGPKTDSDDDSSDSTGAAVEHRQYRFEVGRSGLITASENPEKLGVRTFDWSKYADGSVRVVDRLEANLEEVFRAGDTITTYTWPVRSVRDCIVDSRGRLQSYDGRCYVINEHGERVDRWSIAFDPTRQTLTCSGVTRGLGSFTPYALKQKTESVTVPAGAVPGPIADLNWLTRPLKGKRTQLVVGDLRYGPLKRPATSQRTGKGSWHKPLLFRSQPRTLMVSYGAKGFELANPVVTRMAVFRENGSLKHAYTQGLEPEIQYRRMR